ncbi:hypothetical protein FOMPIDRAFT_88752 [Fomitopsis schrenkii]|uniref:Uncharacterized protein n=1 Tax=Fomitopsis schrenkii TaxID=2126942 RepID=S8EFT0_FOMSC|nr:hypothetical protein FOMPIDRAFT_88752 [Fomitopsis schrenkii]
MASGLPGRTPASLIPSFVTQGSPIEIVAGSWTHRPEVIGNVAQSEAADDVEAQTSSQFGSGLDMQQRSLTGGAYLTEGWSLQTTRDPADDINAYTCVQVNRAPNIDNSVDILVHEAEDSDRVNVYETISLLGP